METVNIVTLSGSGSSASITLGTATNYYSGGVEAGNACLFNDKSEGQLVVVYDDTDVQARVATYDDSDTNNTITLGTIYLMWDSSATGLPVNARYPSGCVNGIFQMSFHRDDDHDGTLLLGKLTTQSTNMTANQSSRRSFRSYSRYSYRNNQHMGFS